MGKDLWVKLIYPWKLVLHHCRTFVFLTKTIVACCLTNHTGHYFLNSGDPKMDIFFKLSS